MMIETRLVLIAIACVLISAVSLLLFKYRKLHGRKEAEMDKEDVVGRLFIRKLGKIEATVGKDEPDQVFKKLSKTMRSFFSELYDIRYQFDYFELNEELSKKGVKEGIRKDIIDLTMQMSKTEYGGQKITNIVIYPLLEKSLEVVNKVTGQEPEPLYRRPPAGKPPAEKAEVPEAVREEIPSVQVPKKGEMPAAEKPPEEPPAKEPIPLAEKPPVYEVKPPTEEAVPPAEQKPAEEEKPPAEEALPTEKQPPSVEKEPPVAEKLPPGKEAPPMEKPPEKEMPPEEAPPEKAVEAPAEMKEEPVPAEEEAKEAAAVPDVIIPKDDKGRIEKIKRKLLVAEQELRSKDYENAMDSYTELKSIYDSISPDVKASMYDDIKRIIDIYNTLLKEYKDTLLAKK